MFTILKFELKNLFADRSIAIVAVLLLLLILFSFYNGSLRIKKQEKTIQHIVSQEQQFYETLTTQLEAIESGTTTTEYVWHKDPTSPLAAGFFGEAGRSAYLMPAPLAIISSGQSDIYPYYFKVTALSSNTLNNEELENPVNLSSGQFDLAFLLVFLYPLFIIALSYNMLSYEREQGILRLLLAQPLNIIRFLSAKIIIRFLIIILLTAIFIALGFTLFGTKIEASGIAVFALLLIIYSLFWFSLSFFVNLLGKSSSSNALIMIGLWLILVLIIPGVANMTAAYLHPVPSRVAYVNDVREASIEAEKKRNKILDKYYTDHPELAVNEGNEGSQSMNKRWREIILVREESNKLVEKVKQQYEEHLAAQQKVNNIYGYFSPAILFQNALNEVARTNTAYFKAFEKDALLYYENWKAFFMDKLEKNVTLKKSDYNAIPVYQEKDLTDNKSGVAYGLPMLLMSLVFIGLGFIFNKSRG